MTGGRMGGAERELTQRELNRALLARQMLLRRQEISVTEALERLVGMQSQVPNDPFIALWSRVAGFAPDDLSRLMREREAVRGSLMRGTIHVTTTRDYLHLRARMTPAHARWAMTTDRVRRAGDIDIDAILAHAREVLRKEPLTAKALGERLEGRLPDVAGPVAAIIARFILPVVQVTPRGEWGASMQATWAHIEEWAGVPIETDTDPASMLRRYLTAFGPATLADMQAWSGMTGLAAVVAQMDNLVTCRNERGQVLYDVEDGLLPDPATPAPVRFLPGFDNILLSHKDRTRIITEERRAAIGSKNGLFDPTYLVDGMVAGRWKAEITPEAATLRLRPFEAHDVTTGEALEAEGSALLAMLGPDRARRVIFDTDLS